MSGSNETGQVSIRFYEELNFFLTKEKQKTRFETQFRFGDTVKALIESLGIPHTEVDLILVNQNSVSFSYQLKNRDRVSVYPVFESFNIAPLTKVRPVPLRETKFILDVHLGRLARYLRVLGFDSHYANSYDDETLSRISEAEGRIVLTRDRGLLKRKIISHGYCIRSRNPSEQLVEVIKRFDLNENLNPFSLCLRCNVPLLSIPKKQIKAKLPPLVLSRYNRFRICPACSRIYWKGSHWEQMLSILPQDARRVPTG